MEKVDKAYEALRTHRKMMMMMTMKRRRWNSGPIQERKKTKRERMA